MIHWFIQAKSVCPHAVYETVYDIDYRAYKTQYDTVLFDLDNTLLPYDNSDINDAIKALFTTLKTLGYQVMIVSNSTSSRVKATAMILDVPWLKSAKKPLKHGFKKALKTLQAEPETTLFIGDQLMTDVWGANRMGMTPMLVRAIKRKSERWYTRFNRYLERKMLVKLTRYAPEKAKEIKAL